MWSNYVTVLMLPFPILANMLLSSYCDKVGHKLPLILPVVSFMIGSVYLSLLVVFLSWPMWTVLIFPILYTMFGGYSTVSWLSSQYHNLLLPCLGIRCFVGFGVRLWDFRLGINFFRRFVWICFSWFHGNDDKSSIIFIINY